MANRWENNGNSNRLNLGGSKVTADGDYSHEIEICLKKSYDKPRQHTQKQRHYFVDKGPSIQNTVFPVVMNECESWTIKNAEHQSIGAF